MKNGGGPCEKKAHVERDERFLNKCCLVLRLCRSELPRGCLLTLSSGIPHYPPVLAIPPSLIFHRAPTPVLFALGTPFFPPTPFLHNV